MVSPWLSYSSTRRARSARLPRAAVAVAACATVLVATAATPVAHADGPSQAVSKSWNRIFEAVRPVAVVDTNHLIVEFNDPSLGEWSSSGKPLSAKAQSRWLARAEKLQQRRIDALAKAGVQFRVIHRYVRVANGVSIVVQGDNAQRLRSVAGVERVTPVRTIWPATSTNAGAGTNRAAVKQTAKSAPREGTLSIAVLDAALDPSAGSLAGNTYPAIDARRVAQTAATAAATSDADAHGTAVADLALRSAGSLGKVAIQPITVLSKQPTRAGIDAVFGTNDDLIAGLELAVDPNADGRTADAARVALLASGTPYASFASSIEARAARGAHALGTLVVAPTGNDGVSGDSVGTVGSTAASETTLAVGAADLRAEIDAIMVDVAGDGIEDRFADSPLLNAPDRVTMPSGAIRLLALDANGVDVVDYLDAELRSRVTGATVLVDARDGVQVAAQIRAAADAGAKAILIAGDDLRVLAGTVDAVGDDIPAIALTQAQGRDLRAALRDGAQLSVTVTATRAANDAFGSVAGFSATGPRFDGVARPDVVAAGVGMLAAAPGGTTQVVTGTSVATAWAAGQAASLRLAQPTWSTADVRAALIDSSVALGTSDSRPSVHEQGGGVVNAQAAAAVKLVHVDGRIEFGSVAPGARGEVKLAMRIPGSAVSDATMLPKLHLDDGGATHGIVPTLDGDLLVIDVPSGAATQVVGGWLVIEDSGIRIPWSATIRDNAATTSPISLSLDRVTMPARAGRFTYPSTLSVGIGGTPSAGTLGLAGVERFELQLYDATNKLRGRVGVLDHALPGVYTVGVAPRDAQGKPLKAGAYTLRARYVPATDADGAWRSAGSVTFTVTAPRRSAK